MQGIRSVIEMALFQTDAIVKLFPILKPALSLELSERVYNAVHPALTINVLVPLVDFRHAY